jgi:TPR repeat protein
MTNKIQDRLYEFALLTYQCFDKLQAAAQWYIKAVMFSDEPNDLHALLPYHDNLELMRAVAKNFEINAMPEKAILFYSYTLKQQDSIALQALQTYAQKNIASAEYVLAIEYYHKRGELLTAAKHCMRAAEKGHQPAQNYLKTTQFNAIDSLSLAQEYHYGYTVSINFTMAHDFYK